MKNPFRAREAPKEQKVIIKTRVGVHFCAGSPSSPIAANQGLYGILAGVAHKIYTLSAY